VARTVPVVEEVLHPGVVGRQNGKRQYVFRRHGLQLQNARGGLLRGSEDVTDEVGVVFYEAADELRAVVDDNVWARLERGMQVVLEVFV
jgi:hypothetical protein